MPPQRSTVHSLPDEMREEFEKRLIRNGFSGYAHLVEWLGSQGWEISRSAAQRYGSRLRSQVERIRIATEHAEALLRASPDEAGALSDASIRVIQERMFDVLMQSEDGSDVRSLASAARALAETARASVAVRQDRRVALKEAARAAAEEAAKSAKGVHCRRLPSAARGLATHPRAGLRHLYGPAGQPGPLPRILTTDERRERIRRIRAGIRDSLDQVLREASAGAERDRQSVSVPTEHDPVDACRAARFYDVRGWPRTGLPLDARRYANHLALERRTRQRCLGAVSESRSSERVHSEQREVPGRVGLVRHRGRCE